MPFPPQSPEFARLATRWLDGSATDAEAAQLWEHLRNDPDCAREFATHARFELLLEDTLRETQREQKVAAKVGQEMGRRHSRIVRRRMLAAAAAAMLLGFLAWLALPGPGPTAPQVTHAPTVSPSISHLTLPEGVRRGTTVLLARNEPAGPPAASVPAPETLRHRLDDFFLLGVDLDKVPLGAAIKRLEDQLRELNFANAPDLASLHVQIPAAAANKPVTFHSGSISFLKAVQALAGLIGYDLDVGTAALALVSRPNADPYRTETRSIHELAASFGTPSDSSRDRTSELIRDAFALGLKLFLSDGVITNVQATPGELQALALLAQSRDQVRAMPPAQFYIRAAHGSPGAQDRILTGQDADRERQDFFLSGGSNPPFITVPLTEHSATPQASQPGVILFSAGPVGDHQIYLNLSPGQLDAPPSGNADPSPKQNAALSPQPAAADPLLAVFSRKDVLQINTTVPASSVTIALGAGGTTGDPGSINPKSDNITGSFTTTSTGSSANLNGSTAVLGSTNTVSNNSGNLTFSSSMNVSEASYIDGVLRLTIQGEPNAALSASIDNLRATGKTVIVTIIPATPPP